MITYRPDVDGLRAIAVIPVVFFHASIAGFGGGFVGVDVFFVISGFLITSLLAKEIIQGQFSTRQFYERRLRRIFPALITMFAFCWIIGSALLMPHDFRAFARSTVASGLFSSNILFWLEGGYFDGAAEIKPLLHTWSLSVEEQFYIVFPVLLAVLLNKIKYWKSVLIIIFFASLLSCGLLTQSRPNAAFYLPFFRVWELLAGSFVALFIGFYPFSSIRLRTILSLVGAGFLLWAMLTFDRSTVFPGFEAVFPCLGATLIIAYAHGTYVGRILATAPLVWIGKLSYSLYLWHWPIIVFIKYYTGRDLEVDEKVFVVGISVLVAYLSLRFIETPFRVRRLAPNARWMVGMSIASMTFFLLAGVTTYLASGFPGRFSVDVQMMAKGAGDTNPDRNRCDRRSAADVVRGDVCVVGQNGVLPTFAIIGDSFGDALVPGIERAAFAKNRRGLVLTSSGCYPLEGVSDMNSRGDTTCLDFVRASLDLIHRTASITQVILVGRWTSAALGTRFGASIEKDWFINDVQSHELTYRENRRVFERSLRRTVQALPGRNVYIVSRIPEQRIVPPRELALCRYLGRACPGGVSLAEFEARQSFTHGVIVDISKNEAANVIDVGARLCSMAGCMLVSGGDMLYSDDNHLSRAGAIFLQDLFIPVFASPARRQLVSSPER